MYFTDHIFLNTITFRCSKDKQIYPVTMFRRGRMSRNRIMNSETRKTLLREISPSLPLTLRIKNGDKMQNIKVNLTFIKYLFMKKDLNWICNFMFRFQLINWRRTRSIWSRSALNHLLIKYRLFNRQIKYRLFKFLIKYRLLKLLTKYRLLISWSNTDYLNSWSNTGFWIF